MISHTRHRGRHRGRRRRAVLRQDRGAASAELVIAAPLLLTMLLLIVQFALWSHATHVAQAAAAQGLAAARAQDGSTTAGTSRARTMLDQLAGEALTDTHVSVDRTAQSASVRITATASSIVPFLTLRVHAEAVGPVERFTTDPGAG